MIAVIRKYVKKGGLQIVLWLTLFSLVAGMFVSFRSSTKKSYDSIGTVNDFHISRSDFVRKVTQENRLIQRIREQLGPDADLFLKQQGYDQNPEERVLDGLVDDALLRSAAKKLGSKISPEYMESKVSDPSFLMDSLSHLIPQEVLMQGNVNVSALMHYLQRQGLSDKEFDSIVRKTLQKMLLSQIAAGTLYVPEFEVKDQYVRLYSKKKFGILTLSMEEYVKKAKAKKPDISDEELKAFFHKHSANYLVAEKRSGTLWTFDPANYNIVVAPKEIQEYYLKNKKQFIEKPEALEVKRILIKVDENADSQLREKKKKAATEIANKVSASPEKFEEIAKKQSDGKEKGATLTLKRGEVDSRLESAAFALVRDGAVSSVIQTKDGFEIVKRVSKKDPVYKDEAAAKDEIVKKLQKDKFGRQFNMDAQRIVSQSQEQPQLFKNFIKDKKADSKNIENQVNDASATAKRLFGLKENGKSFYTGDGKGYLIQLDSIAKSYLPELNTVRTKVTSDFYKDMAQKALKADLDAAHKAVNKGATLASEAKKLKGEYSVTGWVDPNAAGFKEFEKNKIPTNRVVGLTRVKKAVEEVTSDNGYLVELLEVAPINEVEFNDKKSELLQYIYQAELSYLHHSLINALKNKAKININSEVTRKIKR